MPVIKSHPHTTCAEKGCTRAPREWSYWCPLHASRAHFTGSATGRLLRKAEVKPYLAEAASVLDALADHRSVVAALKWIDALLAGHGLSREEAPWIRRLRDAEVEPSLVLVTLTAVVGATLYLRLEDGVALDANIGNALVRIVPAPRRGRKANGDRRYSPCPPTVFRPLGRRVRDTLGALMYRVWELYEAAYQRDSALKMDLSARAVASLGADTLTEGGQFLASAAGAHHRPKLPGDDPAAIPEPTEDSRKSRTRSARPVAPGLDDTSKAVAMPRAPRHSYSPNIPAGFDPEAILKSGQ